MSAQKRDPSTDPKSGDLWGNEEFYVFVRSVMYPLDNSEIRVSFVDTYSICDQWWELHRFTELVKGRRLIHAAE